jgi:uncharacterized protein YkwD
MLRSTTLVLAFVASSAAPEPDLLTGRPLQVPFVPAAPTARAAFAGSVVAELNRVRAVRGLGPLRSCPALTTSARRHSTEMGVRGFFDHDSADGTPFWRRIERFYADRGFRSWAVGENIFWQSPATLGAAAVVRSWLGSPGHRENVLSRRWRQVGVGAISVATAPGVYGGSAVTIVTVDFGSRRR